MNTNTTAHLLAKAAHAGQAAYAANEMRAPALSPIIRSMLLDTGTLGGFAHEYNMRIMKAFTDGFDAAAEYEARGIITAVTA